MTPIDSESQHDPIRLFAVENGELIFANMPIGRLVERVGQTPFYAYDRQILTEQFALLKRCMPKNLKIHYAVKANPMPAVVQHMASLVDGFDLASAGEMRVALDTKMSADNISFAGPGKRSAELRQAIAAGVTINVESVGELHRIADIAEQLGIVAKIALRINPAFELKSSGMKMGGGPKPFGIDAEQAPAVLQTLQGLGLAFQGFHIYSGSQNLKTDAIIESQRKSLQLASMLSSHSPTAVQKLNIGGGFGIPYFPGEKPLDVKRIGEALAIEMQLLEKQLSAEIIIELGRYLVGEAGIYVTRIVDKKVSRGQTYLVADGGLHHHLALSGNFGQVIRKNYPVCIGNKMGEQLTEQVTVVGPLCTPLDILADKMLLPVASIGDLLVVFQSGAYGYTASPGKFLSQPEALEVLV
jgi:diaminopimelate decarboxylase